MVLGQVHSNCFGFLLLVSIAKASRTTSLLIDVHKQERPCLRNLLADFSICPLARQESHGYSQTRLPAKGKGLMNASYGSNPGATEGPTDTPNNIHSFG